MGQQRRFWPFFRRFFQEKRQVLRSVKDVERSVDKKEARVEGDSKGKGQSRTRHDQIDHGCPSPSDKQLPPIQEAYIDESMRQSSEVVASAAWAHLILMG